MVRVNFPGACFLREFLGRKICVYVIMFLVEHVKLITYNIKNLVVTLSLTMKFHCTAYIHIAMRFHWIVTLSMRFHWIVTYQME